VVWFALSHILYRIYRAYGTTRISIDWFRETFGRDADENLRALVSLSVVKIGGDCLEVNVDVAKKISEFLNIDSALTSGTPSLLALAVKGIEDMIGSGKIRPVECRSEVH